MKKKPLSDVWPYYVAVFFFIIFLKGGLSIPDHPSKVDHFDIAALVFLNGVFDGWADDIAAHFWYATPTAATEAFRNAILTGERDYPVQNAIFNVLGAFFSIGGVLAVYVARQASNAKQAFKLGFGAEIVESIVYHIGYYTTVGSSALSREEVVITLFVAVVMGFVAMGMRKKHAS
jgi:hypothetical protein